jgi:hypothetical protein
MLPFDKVEYAVLMLPFGKVEQYKQQSEGVASC